MPNYRLSGSTAELTVKNNKGFAIRLIGVKFDSQGQVAGSAVLLSPGSSVDVMVQDIALCTPGQQLSHAVSIMYEDQVTGRQFTFTGATQITGTCQ